MPHESDYEQPPFGQLSDFALLPGNGEKDGKGAGDLPGVSDGAVDEHGASPIVEGDGDDQDPFGLELPF